MRYTMVVQFVVSANIHVYSCIHSVRQNAIVISFNSAFFHSAAIQTHGKQGEFVRSHFCEYKQMLERVRLLFVCVWVLCAH